MFRKSGNGGAPADKSIAVEMLRTNVMIADEKLVITYINPSLRDLLSRAEAEIRRELPAFNVKTLIGSNIDIFHKNPSHQRNMLTVLDRQYAATIRVGQQIFDLVVSPLKQGTKRIGFAVEWADAKERLLNEDYAGQIAAIGRSMAAVQFTPDGNIIEANDIFLNVTGYSLSEIKGKHHSMFVEPALRDSSEYTRFWEDLRRGQYQTDEYRCVGKGGKLVFIQGSYNPILDGSGKVLKVVTFATDITQRVHAVNEVGNALGELAGGNLEQRIDQPFIPELDKLRLDLNRAVGTLQTTMQQVNQSADTIRSGVAEIANAADNLSRRTEQQAANLEQTAAALDEITETVKKSAQGATHAREVVEAADADAKQSAGVVRRAVEAMDMISASAKQINQIIGVIDEIAFQTNLLALNAGVEAARAGDAGRGFAVVASEVRALAQRSAEAAKEIKNLISTSTTQVDSGVKLVTDAGTSLERIMSQVAEINTIVTRIAAGAQEQATGLMQVNTAINQMDQMTQQNATMVEESTAATHALSQETSQLAELVSQFQVGHMADAPRREARRGVPVHVPAPREPVGRYSRAHVPAFSD